MTDSDLLAAIVADPTAKALADAGNDAGCAARLSSILPPVVAPISTAQLLLWSASRGVLAAVFGGTGNASHGVASACLAIQAMTKGGATSLDLTHPAIAGTGGLIDGLVTAGILPANTATAPAVTPGSKADLLAYGSVPVVVRADDVSRVYLVNRPGGRIA